MIELLNSLFAALSPLWEMSLTAAYAAAVVALLRLVLKRRAPRQVLCLLWLVVFARLLIPVSLESPLSIVPDGSQTQMIQTLPSGTGEGQGVSAQNPAQDQHPAQNPSGGAATPVSQGNGNPGPALAVPGGVTPVVPQPERQTSFPWQALLAGVWLAGALAMGGYGLGSYLRLKRRLFDAIRAQDGAWEHPAVGSPFILGVIRPRIYIPAGLYGQPRQFILCHERAHLRRGDHIVKPVCWLALALHWFNPAVWMAFLLMSRDIEAACDEAVIRRLGTKVKADYSATLLSLATNGRIPAPCPLAFDEGDAKGRIKNVLGYRRPALWVVVVSVTAAALAAVCLLTDPVSAEAPEDGPDSSADVSEPPEASQSPDEGLNYLLDPWMLEVLNGERTFSSGRDEFNIHQLRTMVYGDEDLPRLTLEVGKLAFIDLDRDGINEMVVWPVDTLGERDDPTEIGYYTGYFIFRRTGDDVHVDYPGWRSCEYLKADGTFEWSSSAFEWGTGSARFNNGVYEVEQISWCADYEKKNENAFVNGVSATWEEFEAAIAAQQAKPEPTWYIFEDGRLKLLSTAASINVPIPLDDYALAAPVPGFLNEEQQTVYRQAYVMYSHIFGPNTEGVDDWPGGAGFQDSTALPGGYIRATGLYTNWADFEEAVLSVFTQEYWDTKNDSALGPIYKNVDGRLCYISAARGNHGCNPNFPETFRLVEQTDDAISFIMTGYYSDDRQFVGAVSDAKRAAWLAAGWENTIEYPMRMVKTESGWRFDEFHNAQTDSGTGQFQMVPNPNAPVMDDIPEPEPTPFTAPDTVCPHGLEHAAFKSMDGTWDLYCTVDNFTYTKISSNYYYSMFEHWDLDGDGQMEMSDYTKDGQIVVFDVEDGQFNTWNFDPAALNRDFRENCSVEIIDSFQHLQLSYEGQTLLVGSEPDFFLAYDSAASEAGVYRDQTTYALGSDGLFRSSAPVDLSSYGALETPAIHWSIRYTGGGAFQVVPGSFQFELLH